MEIESLMNVALDTGGKIDVLWGMFISVHAAVFGFLFFADSRLNFFGASVLVLIYLSFAYLNYSSLHSSYRLLNAVLMDLNNYFSTHPNGISKNFQKYLKSVDVNSMHNSSFLIHASSGILTMLATCRKAFLDARQNRKE